MAGSIGADGYCPGDDLAAPYLARIYRPEPQPAAEATAPGTLAAATAVIEARALATARAITPG